MALWNSSATVTRTLRCQIFSTNPVIASTTTYHTLVSQCNATNNARMAHETAGEPQPFISSADGIVLNPANGSLEFAVTPARDGSITVAVFDVLGRLAFSTEHANLTAGGQLILPVKLPGNMPPGLYVLRASGPGYEAVRKLSIR